MQKKMLLLDDKFKKYDISKIRREDTDNLYEILFHKIKNYSKFKVNLLKILDKNPRKNELTDSEYYYIAFCYFLSLKNLYYKLLRLNPLNPTNGYIKHINISIIEILAILLNNFNYLYELSFDKIFTDKGFIPLNDKTLKLYNNTISSYNDFMTVFYNIISFINDNCEETCKIPSKISETINKLKMESTKLNTMVVNFMNQHGQSFKTEFVQVIQKSQLNNKNKRKINQNNQNNSSSAATTQQTSLLPENKQNSQKKSGCSIL